MIQVARARKRMRKQVVETMGTVPRTSDLRMMQSRTGHWSAVVEVAGAGAGDKVRTPCWMVERIELCRVVPVWTQYQQQQHQ